MGIDCLSSFLSCWVTQLVIAVAVGAVGIKQFMAMKARAKASKEIQACDPEAVVLYCFPRLHGKMIQMSFPCMKVEAYMRMARIPYTLRTVTDGGISPTERLPCIVHKGRSIAESEFIIEYLQNEFNRPETLSPWQRAKKTALRRLTEDSLRYHVYRTTIVDNLRASARLFSSTFFPDFVPESVKLFIIRKTFRKQLIHILNTSGQGDLTDEQYQTEMVRDLESIKEIIAESGPFALGKQITSADASVFAVLYGARQYARAGCEGRGLKALLDSAELCGYIVAVEKALFPDADELLAKKQWDGAKYSF